MMSVAQQMGPTRNEREPMNTTMKRPRGTSAEEQTILDRFATRTRRAARHNIEALRQGTFLVL